MQAIRSEEHTSELQSPCNLVCRLLLEKTKKKDKIRLVIENADDVGSGATVQCISLSGSCHASDGRASSSTTGGLFSFFFFFNDTATTEIYTLSLHDALPI